MPQNNDIYNALSKHALFALLPQETLAHLSNSLSKRRFKKGQYLFLQGEAAKCCYVIVKGKVLLESISIDGERLLFAHLMKGHLFGEFALLDDGGRSTSAVATMPVTLIRIPKTAFLKLIPEHADFALGLIKHLVGLTRGADAQMESMQFRTLLQKVAHHLAREFLQTRPDNNELRLTQTDVARALSASREKVNKALQTLKHRKVILTGRGRITVQDIEALQDIYSDT